MTKLLPGSPPTRWWICHWIILDLYVSSCLPPLTFFPPTWAPFNPPHNCPARGGRVHVSTELAATHGIHGPFHSALECDVKWFGCDFDPLEPSLTPTTWGSKNFPFQPYTVDGRYPAPHGMYKTTRTQWDKLSINWCRISSINRYHLLKKTAQPAQNPWKFSGLPQGGKWSWSGDET